MKKLTVIFAGLALVALCSVASAETILSDKVLGGLYAGQYGVGLNDLAINNSAVIEQGNIAAIVASDNIYDAKIKQKNRARVTDVFGESTAALQSNVAAMVSLCGSGDIMGVKIKQENCAKVTNWYDGDDNGGNDITAASVDAVHPYGWATINGLALCNISAAALQSNIGAIVNLAGGVAGAKIEQSNCARVLNHYMP